MSNQSATPRTILVAEDNPEDAEWLRRVLTRAGYTPVQFEDGEEALAYLRHHPYPETRLAILDVVMPGLDGQQLGLELQRYVELRQIPLILVSGFVDDRYLDRNLRAEFMRKPLDPDTLLACIARLVGGPRSEES